MALSDYAKYKKLTIDSSKIDSDLSHFPVAIPLGTAVGLTDADVTDIFTEVGSDYLKIAVFMADESTELYVEVEQWDATNNKGLLWVSRDTWSVLAASDVDIYLAFDSTAADNTAYVGTPGNRTEVWNSDFILRYGMAQDPSGGTDCIIDSTSNANHGTPQGSMTPDDLVDGEIGKAIEFDGNDDFIRSKASLGITGAASRTAVVRAKSNTALPAQWDKVLFFGGTSENTAYQIVHYNTSGDWGFGLWISDYNSNIPIDTDWHKLIFRYDGSILNAFVDLTDAIGDQSPAVNTSDSQLDVGGSTRHPTEDYFWPITISEARIYQSAISDDWNKADYHAQTDNLLTFGATQETVSEPAVTTNSASDVTGTSATLNGTLDNLGGETSVDVYFEWGLTTSYGSTTTAQTLSATGPFSDSISGLTADETYHFRAAVTDGVTTWYGDDRTFTASTAEGGGNAFFMFPF